jgi:signal transduction histidine kinase
MSLLPALRALPMSGPRDEPRLLADMTDRLLERLEAAFEAQRRFAADASHELRTPLAMMRTTLDVAIAKPGGVPPQMRQLDAKLHVDLDHRDRLLESFLALAAHNGRVSQDQVALEPPKQPDRNTSSNFRARALSGQGGGDARLCYAERNAHRWGAPSALRGTVTSGYGRQAGIPREAA